MSTILYVILALLLLGIMVTVHELGHFTAARACGIAVRAFGVGFGPKIFSRKSKKSGTEYSLRAIPGGGFCAFYGEDDITGEQEKTDPRSFTIQPAWKRLIVMAAGPIMNFVLVFVAALIFFSAYGLPYEGDTITTQIVSVTKDSPADKAGMLAEDIITEVNGEVINGNFSEKITAWDGTAPLEVKVSRADGEHTLYMTPDYISTEGRYMIGVTMTQSVDVVWTRAGFGKTVSHTADVCVDAGGAILTALKNLVTRGEGIDQMSGPVGVISIIAEQTREYKMMGYLNMLIVISINLGLVNLLPIPGLDGCRIVFVVIEMILRRPVNRKVEAYVHLVGYIFLIGLMLFFTFHDVLNFFG